MIVKFYCEDFSFMWDIKNKDGEEPEKKEIEELLDKYREEEPYYDDMGFYDYLTEKGYVINSIVEDYLIYF